MPSPSIGNRRHLYQAILDPGRVGKIERLPSKRRLGWIGQNTKNLYKSMSYDF
jgi:hypothetical protein